MERHSIGERVMNVKTKIIATVGPACETARQLTELAQAGVDIFRLNFAHGSHDWLERIVAAIREVSRTLDRPIGILGDLAGPKIRLEELPGGALLCQAGERFEFVRIADPAFPNQLTCSYGPLVEELQLGDRVLLADGAVTMHVIEKHVAPPRVVCLVDQAGEIRSRQGVNLPGVVLSTPSLTDKDRDDLAWALKSGLDFIGLSFVRSPQDVQLLRQAIVDLKPAFEPRIVAKIEKPEAVAQLDCILEETDVVMVARGDLGVEVDLALVPVYQKRIIKQCNAHRIPVITATQMLDSMENHNRPTRAEAADVANAVLDGSDAVMLSGETAIGRFAVEAVTAMSRIAREAEQILPPVQQTDTQSLPRSRALAVTEAVTLGAARAAEHLSADLIVVATRSGRTALSLSRQRSPIPILGVSDSPEAARRMCLYWGVTPLVTDTVHAGQQELLRFVVEWCRRHHVLKSGGKLVLVSSSNWSAEGHDQILVHAIP